MPGRSAYQLDTRCCSGSRASSPRSGGWRRCPLRQRGVRRAAVAGAVAIALLAAALARRRPGFAPRSAGRRGGRLRHDPRGDARPRLPGAARRPLPGPRPAAHDVHGRSRRRRALGRPRARGAASRRAGVGIVLATAAVALVRGLLYAGSTTGIAGAGAPPVRGGRRDRRPLRLGQPRRRRLTGRGRRAALRAPTSPRQPGRAQPAPSSCSRSSACPRPRSCSPSDALALPCSSSERTSGRGAYHFPETEETTHGQTTTVEPVCERVESRCPRTLVVAGTADPRCR